MEEPEAVFASAEAALEAVPEETEEAHIRDSRQRGLILHKLMEEVLTGETLGDVEPLQVRAAELITQLGHKDAQDAAAGPTSAEMAATVVRTLQLPELTALWPRLVPEFRVYASTIEDCAATLTAGIADAVAIDEEGHIDVVVDWKSDVNPGAEQVAIYREQVHDYLQSTAAPIGLIVLLGSDSVVKVMRGDCDSP